MKFVVITRNHPTLKFCQLVDGTIVPNQPIDVVPEGTRQSHRISNIEIWPVHRAYEYAAYNKALESVK